jgi:hypothetical protein
MHNTIMDVLKFMYQDIFQFIGVFVIILYTNDLKSLEERVFIITSRRPHRGHLVVCQETRSR